MCQIVIFQKFIFFLKKKNCEKIVSLNLNELKRRTNWFQGVAGRLPQAANAWCLLHGLTSAWRGLQCSLDTHICATQGGANHNELLCVYKHGSQLVRLPAGVSLHYTELFCVPVAVQGGRLHCQRVHHVLCGLFRHLFDDCHLNREILRHLQSHGHQTNYVAAQVGNDFGLSDAGPALARVAAVWLVALHIRRQPRLMHCRVD